MTKIVYLFDENNAFSGVYEAQESPLEQGVYITPVLSTDIPPPNFTENQTCNFVDGIWVVEDIQQPIPEPVIPPTIEQIRASMLPLNRVQFKTVMLKNNLWIQAQTLADSLGIEAQVKLSDGQVFERMDDTLNSLAGQLALSDDQVDALFNEGYGY